MSGSPSSELLKALRDNYLFKELEPEDLTALAREVWLEEIPSGSAVVSEGDEADALYVVVQGGVNVTKADGQFLAYLGPGGFFGEMALFMEGSLRSATCISTEDTVCAVVQKSVLDGYCTAHPPAGLSIYRTIIKTLAERLQNTSADLAFLMGAQVRKQRDVDALIEKAKKKKKR